MTDGTASSRQTIRLGNTDNSTTPGNVQAFTGGDSIALRWKAVTDAQQYYVYRNGSRVATVTIPDWSTGYSYEQPGTLYVDKAVTAGSAYTYQVQAQLANNTLSAKSASVAATQPTSTTAVPDVTINLNGLTGLDDYASKGAATMQTWYPKQVDLLARDSYSPPANLALTIVPDSQTCYGAGWVYFGTSTVNVCESWARANPNDYSLFIHEPTHIIQAYTQSEPTMLVEGLASWTADHFIGYAQPLPDQTHDYLDGYAEGSYFISWITSTYKLPTFAHDLNVAAHLSGTQPDTIMQQKTGKTISQLWTQMTGRRTTSIGKLGGANSQCADIWQSNFTAGATTDIYTCNGTSAQKVLYREGDTAGQGIIKFTDAGFCLALKGNAITEGTPVVLANCDITSTYDLWQPLSNTELKNVASGKCLRPTGGSATAGTALQITSCNAAGTSPDQKWTLPAN